MRSPDEAERNPGLPRGADAAPDFAALHPGYVRYAEITPEIIQAGSCVLYDLVGEVSKETLARLVFLATAAQPNLSRDDISCPPKE